MSYKKEIRETFQNVQHSKAKYPKYIKKLKEVYEKCEIDDFYNEFINNLKLPLSVMENLPCVDSSLQFAAKFAISLMPSNADEDDEDDEMNPFVVKLFDFLLSHHNATNKAVRYRICFFLNVLLNTLGDNASMEDELCTRIIQCMLDRIQDVFPKVRAQAAIALHRLQEPNNASCPVINVYLFHLSKDPSAEVRRVILSKMAKNKQTLCSALKRTRDVDDSVRKEAYLFISRITVKSLTIYQREQLISTGLNDRSEGVKKAVRELLVPAWLRYYDHNYINFIKAIDAERAPETVMKALNCVFKNAETKVLIDQLSLDSNKFLPMEQLNYCTILYWRCLAEFLKNENLSEDFDLIMPELSPLCGYIREFLKIIMEKISQQWEPLEQQFILHQLFEMVKLYDLADELGRKNLKELTLENLTSEHCSEKVSECLVEYFEEVVPDTEARAALLVEVINEKKMPVNKNLPTIMPLSDDERHERIMRLKLVKQLLEDEEYAAIREKNYAKAQKIQEQVEEIKEEIASLSQEVQVEPDKVWEEKDDPETISQCLQIMFAMMQSPKITTLTPTLRSLMESLVLPCVNLEVNDDGVLNLALKCLGLCCHVDRDLAKARFTTFVLHITESRKEDLWITATEIIFDLLLKHGLECFDIASDDDASNHEKRHRSVRFYSHNTDEDANVVEGRVEFPEGNNNVVKILITLLDSHVEKLQTVAAEGLCKLLLFQRISSAHLLSQLLILWHNPVARENAYLNQCLCCFFNYFPRKVQESHTLLEEAYLPTLKTIATAPEMSPLQKIDLLHISEVILQFTCCSIIRTYSIHNNLTFLILTEAQDPESDIPVDVLIKSLKSLEVQFDSGHSKNNIIEALDKLKDNITESGDKRLVKNIDDFQKRLMESKDPENLSRENSGLTAPETNSAADATRLPNIVESNQENSDQDQDMTQNQENGMEVDR